MIIKNKKGGKEIITPWMFFVWAIIAIGIITAGSIFYSSQIDVRQKEAEILNLKIESCLKESKENFDLFADCNLDKEVIDESGMYYVKIEINSKIVDYGIRNFETLCSLNEKSENFPKCYENNFYYEGKKIKILTASNQQGVKI